MVILVFCQSVARYLVTILYSPYDVQLADIISGKNINRIHGFFQYLFQILADRFAGFLF